MEDGDKVSMSDVTITGEGEINSDPKVVKESVSNESNNINDSGLETTPNLIDENNLTQSGIMKMCIRDRCSPGNLRDHSVLYKNFNWL